MNAKRLVRKKKKMEIKKYIRPSLANTLNKRFVIDKAIRNKVKEKAQKEGMTLAHVTDYLMLAFVFDKIKIDKTDTTSVDDNKNNDTYININKDTYLAVNFKMDMQGLNNINSVIQQLYTKYVNNECNIYDVLRANVDVETNKIIPLPDAQRVAIEKMLEKPVKITATSSTDDKKRRTGRTKLIIDAEICDAAKRKAGKDSITFTALIENLMTAWYAGKIKIENEPAKKPAKIRMTLLDIDRITKTFFYLKMRNEIGEIKISDTVQSLLNHYVNNDISISATTQAKKIDIACDIIKLSKPALVVTIDNLKNAVINADPDLIASDPVNIDRFLRTINEKEEVKYIVAKILRRCDVDSFKQYIKYSVVDAVYYAIIATAKNIITDKNKSSILFFDAKNEIMQDTIKELNL